MALESVSMEVCIRISYHQFKITYGPD